MQVSPARQAEREERIGKVAVGQRRLCELPGFDARLQPDLDNGPDHPLSLIDHGLHSSGRGGEAMTVLKDSLVQHPGDRATLSALISFSRDAGDFGSALAYAERLASMMPGDPSLSALIEGLRRRAKASDAR